MKVDKWFCVLFALLVSIYSLAEDKEKAPVLYTNQYVVPPAFLSAHPPVHYDPFAPAETPRVQKPLTAQEVLEAAGVTFGPGAAVLGSGGTSKLIVRNTPEQMDLIEAYIDSLRGGVEKFVRCRIDVFEADRNEILQLLRNHDVDGDQSAAFDEVMEWLSTGKAKQKAGILAQASSGNRSKTVSGIEISYIFDYEKKDGHWQPNRELREIGTSLEIDPVIGADGDTVDLHVNFEHHFRAPEYRNGHQAGEKGGEILVVDFPQFYFGKISTQIVLGSGHYRILGTMEDLSGDKDRSHIVFLTAKIVKARLFQKVFDEKRDVPELKEEQK